MARLVLRTSAGILRNSSGVCCYDFPSSVNVSAIGTTDWWVVGPSGYYGTRLNEYWQPPTIYSFPYTRIWLGAIYTGSYTSIYAESSLLLSLIDGAFTWTLYVKVYSSGRYSGFNYPGNVGTVEWWGVKAGIDPKGTYNQTSVSVTGPRMGTYPSSASVS